MGPPSAVGYAKNEAAAADRVGTTAVNNASQLFSGSFPALQHALSYYQSLASGNQSVVNQAVAPQTNQINQQYDAAIQALGRNMRRGGAQADASTALQLQRTGQISGAKEAAVAGAPQAEANLGETGTQLSQYAIINALNAFATGGNINLGLVGPENQVANNYAQLAATIAFG